MQRNAVDYEEDFYAWTVEQARLLRSGELSALDAANIAEEIESMGRSDRRAIESRLTVLLTNLLKRQLQPTSWSATIREKRRQIEKLLHESPSLRPFVAEATAEAYAEAREDAAEETGLPEAAFPDLCPFTADEVLSRTFLPGP
jgi:Domain of unknown function DUF29